MDILNGLKYIHRVSTTTTYPTIQILRSLFARYGIPNQIVSDNGPQFIATEFSAVTTQWTGLLDWTTGLTFDFN